MNLLLAFLLVILPGDIPKSPGEKTSNQVRVEKFTNLALAERNPFRLEALIALRTLEAQDRPVRYPWMMVQQYIVGRGGTYEQLGTTKLEAQNLLVAACFEYHHSVIKRLDKLDPDKVYLDMTADLPLAEEILYAHGKQKDEIEKQTKQIRLEFKNKCLELLAADSNSRYAEVYARLAKK